MKSWLKSQHAKTKIMASGLITSWQIEGGKSGSSERFYFLELELKSLQIVTAAMKLKDDASWREN